MMKKFLIVINCFIGLTALSQTSEEAGFLFIDNALNKPAKKFLVAEIKFPPEIEALAQRFQSALAENKIWAEQYIAQNTKKGEALPYHENFGITREEYQKVLAMGTSKKEVSVTDSIVMRISRDSGFIKFSADHEMAAPFVLLEIIPAGRQLLFNGDTIPFKKTITAPDSNPFGKWEGFIWRKENSNQEQIISTAQLTGKVVEINIGKILSTGKILFRLKYREVIKGEMHANYDQTFYIE